MHQRPWRCWRCPKVSAATSDRRKSAPEENSQNGPIAQSPSRGNVGRIEKGLWAWRTESQLPTRIPVDLALLTRLIPAANSGASNPLSAASAASFRIADILIMMEDEPRLRASRDTRQALTVALVKPGRGACWNQARNSLSAML